MIVHHHPLLLFGHASRNEPASMTNSQPVIGNFLLLTVAR